MATKGNRKQTNPKWDALDAISHGSFEKAQQILERLQASGPPDPDVMNNLTAVYEKLKIDQTKQVELLETAYRLFPSHTLVKSNLTRLYFNVGLSFARNKDFTTAIPLFEKSLQLNPQQSLVHLELGNAFKTEGIFEKALFHYTKSVNLNPNSVGGYTGFGLVLMEMGKLAEAKGAFQTVLSLDPKNVSAFVHLGLLANKTGLTGVAVNMMQRALELEPNNVAALNNLGLILRDQGEINAAFDCYAKAKDIDPNQPEVASGFLLTLNYLPDMNAERMALEHRRIDQVYPAVARIPPIRDLHPHRKLRLGYLSADFNFHSVAYFIVGLLREHNRHEVDVSCYYTGYTHDSLTEQIKTHSDHFIQCYRWSDDRLANQIEHDEIDILIELNGHTRDHRLSMLRNRIAPVQVTYLGYPNTTGLSSMDLRITDSIADPPGPNDHLYCEQLARIDGGFLSYTPPTNAQKLNVGPLPGLSKPGLSFGSFNNLAKINDQVLHVWAQILDRIPQSTLIIKARGTNDERVTDRLRKHLSLANMDESRVTLKSYELFYEEHMSCYREIDLALDTFPYTGTTTTCEALWMGVPVLSLAGSLHVGRVSQSILTRIGLEEFICQDTKDYVERAVRWASNRPKLAELRLGMRERMQASTLMDHCRMAQGLESVYRTAWIKYCQSVST